MFCFGCYHNPLYDTELRAADKTKNFSYAGRKFTAKVVDIYDGDTITVVFRYRGQLEQHRVRLLGIDTPELKPPKTLGSKKREVIIKGAHEAREALVKLIGDDLIHLYCEQFDKYGRILGTIKTRGKICHWRSKIDINRWLIDHKYGVSYDGGTKLL